MFGFSFRSLKSLAIKTRSLSCIAYPTCLLNRLGTLRCFSEPIASWQFASGFSLVRCLGYRFDLNCLHIASSQPSIFLHQFPSQSRQSLDYSLNYKPRKVAIFSLFACIYLNLCSTSSFFASLTLK